MKKHIKALSLVLAFVMISLCLASCGGSEDSNKQWLLDNFKDNTLKEGVKYYFDSGEVMIDFPRYYEMRDSLSQDQYDALKAQVEAECQESLQRKISKMFFYTVAEDGSYIKHSNKFYIFEGGNVYSVCLDHVGEGYLNESIGLHEGIEVYYSYSDPWDELGGAEAFKNASYGTYEENTINIEMDDWRAEIYDGKLIVEEMVENDVFIPYTMYYKYYYKPAD